MSVPDIAQRARSGAAASFGTGKEGKHALGQYGARGPERAARIGTFVPVDFVGGEHGGEHVSRRVLDLPHVTCT
eukprot:1655551-Rhodomonas_salina.1